MVHVLIRWSHSREPRTVELHQQVAAEHGSVWWCRFGDSLPQARLDQLRGQLTSGQPTYVILHSQAASTVRTRLLEVTNDQGSIDERLVPDYVDADEGGAFFRLTDFEPVPEGWLERNVVLESKPASNITSALRGMSNLMWVLLDDEEASGRGVGDAYFCFNQGAGTASSAWTVEGESYTFYQGVSGAAWLVEAGEGRFAWCHVKGYPGPTASHFVGVGTIDRIEDLGIIDTGEDDKGAVQRWKAHLRDYERFPSPVPISEFDPRPNYQHSINRLSSEDFEELKRRGALEVVAPLTVGAVKNAAQRPGRDLQLDDDVYAAVVAAVRSGKHVILTGPPGTGKTTLAEATAEAARASGLCRGHVLTTATADWTTFETIGGLQPTAEGPLAFADGQFLGAIRRNEWLVIDELNRANFDRAFGQFFTVLSGQTVVLPYDDPHSAKPIALVRHGSSVAQAEDFELVTVERDWRIIGTMNVFDKSLLFEMSYALMRRFAFIEIPAPPDRVYEQLIDRELAGASDTDAETARTVVLGLLRLRALKEMGPAIYIDMARFARELLAVGAISPGALSYQLFYSLALPQFEGISDVDGEALFTELVRLMPTEKARARRDLIEVLGILSLRTTPRNDTDIVDEDVDE